MDYIIGIDLGTRYSCVSVWMNGKCVVISDQFGNRSIPSIVSFYRSARLVGHNALVMKDVDPANTIYDIKRLIGRRATEEQVDMVRKLVTYTVLDDESEHHNVVISTDNGRRYRPEEICAYILAEIKRLASEYLKTDITKAVITVPAYFNDAQRQATLDAAHIAGLEVMKIINEPTSAALSYGLGASTNKNVMIYDFGAGTLDVSLMNIDNGVFTTLAVSGNNHLGGEDIDYLLMNMIIGTFKKKNGVNDLVMSKLTQLKFKNAVENAKKILSNNTRALVCVENFYDNKNLCESISKKDLERVCNELFIMCIKPISDVLKNAKLSKHDVNEIVLVGGSTRIPKIRKLIKQFFKDTDAIICSNVNPDETVSAGAAIYGHIISNKTDPFTENIVLMDIIALSLGVETLRKQMTTIIPRNSHIPIRKTKVFTTDSDDQDTVSIKVYEGERKLTKNNYHLGTFDLSGFEKGPRGAASIRITFHVDVNGILQVTALEKGSGATNTIMISSMWSSKGRLSKKEIDDIIEESKKYETIDTVFSLKVSLVHQIKTMCETVLINLSDKNTVTYTKVDRRRIKKYITKTIKTLDETNIEDLTVDELKKDKKRIAKKYCILITRCDKETDVKGFSENQTMVEIHGDDEDAESSMYSINMDNDIPDEERTSVKNIKKHVMDLCKNILQIVNNPITRFNDEDKAFIKDYLDSVMIWVMVTASNTTVEYAAKIEDVNKMMDTIMTKYGEDIFTKNEALCSKDELLLTCNTLKAAIESNFFNMDDEEKASLIKLLDDALLWSKDNPNGDTLQYKVMLDQINELCNKYHDSISRVEHIEQESSSEDSSSDDDEEEDVRPNRIRENIADMLLNMPDTPVLLKVETQKLCKQESPRYR